MSSFSNLVEDNVSVVEDLLCLHHSYVDKDALWIADIICKQYILPSLHLSSNESSCKKSISKFIAFCGRIMFRLKTISIKNNKQHKKNIIQYHTNNNTTSHTNLKNELYKLVECQTLLSDLQSMYTQIGRINNMLFGDYKHKLENINNKDIDKTNIMIFPYETQIYLEIGFTQETLMNNFLDNEYFKKLIKDKSKYFNGLYELNNLLELYNIYWIKYKNKWNNNQLNEQNKYKKHYLGKCECCLALYQSFYENNSTIRRLKMKEFAKKLNVNDIIVWSDEEIETETEKQEFTSLTDRLNNLLG